MVYFVETKTQTATNVCNETNQMSSKLIVYLQLRRTVYFDR